MSSFKQRIQKCRYFSVVILLTEINIWHFTLLYYTTLRYLFQSDVCNVFQEVMLVQHEEYSMDAPIMILHGRFRYHLIHACDSLSQSKNVSFTCLLFCLATFQCKKRQKRTQFGTRNLLSVCTASHTQRHFSVLILLLQLLAFEWIHTHKIVKVTILAGILVNF